MVFRSTYHYVNMKYHQPNSVKMKRVHKCVLHIKKHSKKDLLGNTKGKFEIEQRSGIYKITCGM